MVIDLTVTPFDYRKIRKFDKEKIDQVYYGQLNCCRCGCGGEYYTKDDDFINLGIKQLQKHMTSGDIKFDDHGDRWYFEIHTHSKELGEENEDALTYSDSNEIEIGWGFYLLK